ncbi:hypothetical protein [Mesorhizobium sp.]|uniref:hypothetical protein n=1 Tax=Mesorhizobium sp. TaxID=1871066 RepID=UPI0011F6D145|nr:hypothetical protein [Mesorhizobium sp.]TIS97299.1 MAG: hypothetical protein E5W87_27480 [Mesorhizobium sp.]
MSREMLPERWEDEISCMVNLRAVNCARTTMREAHLRMAYGWMNSVACVCIHGFGKKAIELLCLNFDGFSPSRNAGRRLQATCPACGTEHFPRTDPVAIMIAHHRAWADNA